jgi:hypothetical protein
MESLDTQAPREMYKKRSPEGTETRYTYTCQDLVRNDVMYHVDYFATSNITGVRLR